MPKILFLDCDGVLCTGRTAIAYRLGQEDNLLDPFDPVGAGILRAICKETGTKLVISSSWRLNAKMDGSGDKYQSLLWKNLKDNNLLEYLHPDWCTCSFNKKTIRGEEIKMWLSKHANITHYAILDDDEDFLPEQKARHIRISENDGILCADYLKLKVLLGEDKS